MIDQPQLKPADPNETGWEMAIVEIFGHRRHVGRAREEERFGAKMLRIDVPTMVGDPPTIEWVTHYYGGSSIFSFTLTDEETVRRYAERRHTPAIPFRAPAMDTAGFPNDDEEREDYDRDCEHG